MKSVRNACTLQPNALEITVGDQIEQLDEIIRETDPARFFEKTYITAGMRDLLERGVARLAGKSNNSIFHLKQAMGGGKTHLMVGFGLLAKNASDRTKLIGDIPHQDGFGNARIAAFNGRNRPAHYFWGEIATQLGKAPVFREYTESGTKAPDEKAWLDLFAGDDPILILLDEMPVYFHYYATQTLGLGTVADVVTNALGGMLTAAQKKKNVCVLLSDLSAAYDTGGKLIQKALDDARQETGRAEFPVTPVNLESDEIYQILRKRLFAKLPDQNEIADIASVYAGRLSEAARARTVERGADALANEIESTYPFHPAFEALQKAAWYLHKTREGRHYFSHAENLTKKLETYAEKAPQPKVDELIRIRLDEMYRPVTREAYEKVLALPEIDEAEASIRISRSLLIISPDGKTPPEAVARFFQTQVNKNNVLVLTGDRSSMADLDKAARHVYAVAKADAEIKTDHPQRAELDDKQTQYDQDFQSTILNIFDKVLFPGRQGNEDLLRSKVLDATYPSNESYNGERQIIKTLTSDPIKLYTDVAGNFEALRARAEQLLFGNQDDVRKTDLIDKARQTTRMPWLPANGFDQFITMALGRGWEDLRNGYITKKPRPKTTRVVVTIDSVPDDSGTCRLRLDSQHAGSAPRIHYAEDGPVNERSPVLKDNILVTKALRVQFIAVDPTGTNPTGPPHTWTNELTLRNRLDEDARTVELFVAPRGTIRYTIDGTEPREGIPYTGPVSIGKDAVEMLVFAECEGIEAKRSFRFPAAGSDDLCIIRDAPANTRSSTHHKLDSAAKTFEGLRLARQKGITFKHVTLILGSAPQRDSNRPRRNQSGRRVHRARPRPIPAAARTRRPARHGLQATPHPVRPRP